MRISITKSVAVAAATALASVGVLVGTTTAAHATGTVDVTAVSGTVGMRARTSQDVLTIAAKVDPAATQWQPVAVDVYRGATKVGTIANTVDSTGYYQFNRLAQKDNNKLLVTLSNSWGRGTFTLRNLQVTFDGQTVGSTDPTVAGGFRVLHGVNGNLAKHKALLIRTRGKTHKFSVGLSYFNSAGVWKPWVGHKVAIQQKIGARWKTIKVLKLNRTGKATWTRKTSKRFSYRMSTASTSTILGGATNGTSRL